MNSLKWSRCTYVFTILPVEVDIVPIRSSQMLVRYPALNFMDDNSVLRCPQRLWFIFLLYLLQERLRKLRVSIFKKSHFMNILQSHFSNRWSHFGILVLKTLNRTCYSRVLLWLKLLEHRDWQIRTLPTSLILKYFVEMSDRDIWIMNLWRICMHILDWIRIEVCNTSTFYLCRYIFMYGW